MDKRKLFVGMDVSKGYIDVEVLTADKQKFIPGYQLDDNLDGHKILVREVKDYSSQGFHVVCAAENTGGYESNWMNTLKQLSHKKGVNVEAFRVNPKAVKHQIDSLLRRTINDAVSAEGIAMYTINNYDIFKQNWQNTIEETAEIREGKLLLTNIFGLIKERTMEKNRLEKVLYQTFPEILPYLKYGYPLWVLHFLRKYPSAQAVKNAKMNGLTTINYVTKERALTLKEKAKNSVSSINGETLNMIVRQHCENILYFNEQIDRLKNFLIKNYESNEGIKLLSDIKGVAKWSAVAFYLLLGDYKRFNNTDQLAAFFGVNPSYKQSGDGKFKVKMSKQGSSDMRYILFQIANNLYLYNEYFRQIYEKHAKKGKKYKAIIGILMHKVLRVFWAMLKNGTAFSPETDIENQKRSEQKKTSAPVKSNARRLQGLSQNAPVSRTNSKKRKAMIQPQSSVSDECARSKNHSLVQT